MGVKTSAQCPCEEADQTPEHDLQSCSLHLWPPSKVADMAHLRVPQNQSLGVCRGFAPDIQVCGTDGGEDLVHVAITLAQKKTWYSSSGEWSPNLPHWLGPPLTVGHCGLNGDRKKHKSSFVVVNNSFYTMVHYGVPELNIHVGKKAFVWKWYKSDTNTTIEIALCHVLFHYNKHADGFWS